MGMLDHLKLPPPPKDKSLSGWFEWKFRIKERGSTVTREARAGLVLFLVSVFSVLLNPVILSGAASGYNTGMPPTDVALATAISSGAGTLTMGMLANYPWVLGVQLGTNTYFVDSVVGQEVCGANAFFTPNDPAICPGQPCTCSTGPNGEQIVDQVGTADNPGPCFGTTNVCLGSKIAYQKALAATFLEGLVFFILCITGLRAIILKLIPRCILVAGALGIGVFIMFVGWRGMGVVVADKYPNLTRLNTEVQYSPSGWGDGSVSTGIGFNSCVMLLNMPPYGPVCPWLAVGGLVFTAILMLWNVPGSFLIGILFTTFISWIRFPDKVSDGGLVPDKVAYAPHFTETAGSLSFDWSGDVGHLIGAFITFLYLDFIGSAVTFCSLGQMSGLLSEDGDIPNSNIAFIADATASMLAGLLGSSAIVCYVESATGMREGGRTGFAAVVCSILLFASSFLSPLFGQIPSIATSPILVLVGILIFASAVCDINWEDYSDSIPVLTTMTIMPICNNIAYGVIAGIGAYLVCKLFTYQLFDFQKKLPGYPLYTRWSKQYSMFVPLPGWNCDVEGKMSYEDALHKALGDKGPATTPSASSGKLEDPEAGSDSAHGGGFSTTA